MLSKFENFFQINIIKNNVMIIPDDKNAEAIIKENIPKEFEKVG